MTLPRKIQTPTHSKTHSHSKLKTFKPPKEKQKKEKEKKEQKERKKKNKKKKNTT